MSNKHRCRATGDFQLFDGENGKHPYVSVKLRIVAGPLMGVEKTYFGWLSPKAKQYTGEALRALGWRCGDITKLTGLGEIDAMLTLKDEVWEGRAKEQVSVFALGKRKEGIAPERHSAFAALFADLGASVAPVERGDHNKASALPEPVAAPAAAAEKKTEDSPF